MARHVSLSNGNKSTSVSSSGFSRKTQGVRLLVAGLCLVSLGAEFHGGITAQTGSLPAGWTSRDIGTVGVAGSASWSSGTFTVSGSGARIWDVADSFHFAWRSVTGDVTITARVASIIGADPWTKIGVMIRSSTQAGAAHAFTLLSTGNGLAFQRRRIDGSRSYHTAGPAGTAPRWVRLRRTGNVFTASASIDGVTWTTFGSDTITMPSSVLVGLVAHSIDQTRLATGTFTDVAITTPTTTLSRLQVSPNGRFLRSSTTGRHFFYFADTAWGIFRRLNRAEADSYLQDVASKGFTAIQAVALWRMSATGNAYGDSPLGKTGTIYDPSKILTTPGNDPSDPVAYDYWDHVDYIIDRAARNGLYVALEPTWGNYVSGTTSYCQNGSSNIFTVENARVFGDFIGRRYANRTNVIWMLGGDRPAICPIGDFRPVWRAMAEAIGRGVTGQPLVWSQPHAAWSTLLMTYHAARYNDPGSSLWFHNDPWLSFNGIESEYDQIVGRLRRDWNLTPPKPTLLLEARYEDEPAGNGILFTGAFKQRYQLYHAVLGGSLGYGYGHHSIWDFLTSGKTWQTALEDPGRRALRPIRTLLSGLTESQLFNRLPDQTLLDGSVGSARTEDLLVAMRDTSSRLALVYSTNGRDIRLIASRLAAGTADAYWFSPRAGKYSDPTGTIATTTPFASFAAGPGAPIQVLNPPRTPAADNDWLLKVVVR